jgi:hypothetical protein
MLRSEGAGADKIAKHLDVRMQGRRLSNIDCSEECELFRDSLGGKD